MGHPDGIITTEAFHRAGRFNRLTQIKINECLKDSDQGSGKSVRRQRTDGRCLTTESGGHYGLDISNLPGIIETCFQEC